VKGLSLDQRQGRSVREGGVVTETEGIVVLLGRVLFAVFFIRSGIAHIRRHEGMRGYARSAGFPCPGFGGWPAGVWLLAGAASIALGIWADVGSLMIAPFLVLAALVLPSVLDDPGRGSTPDAGGQLLPERRAARRFARAVGFFVAADEAVCSRSPARCSERHPSDGRRHPCSTAPGWATAGRFRLAASRSLRLFH
jgi:uncharacterized membrane protein YphA (DoxX/SURF4 family)